MFTEADQQGLAIARSRPWPNALVVACGAKRTSIGLDSADSAGRPNRSEKKDSRNDDQGRL